MKGAISDRFRNWKANPRRWEFRYILSRLSAVTGFNPSKYAENKRNRALLDPPVEACEVEILSDPEFRRSVDQVKNYSCLDIARLANVWTFARMAGPGIFLEVGAYKGGTALHICNAMLNPNSPFYCFDPFEAGGFQTLGMRDRAFTEDGFNDAQYEAVVQLLSSKPNARAVQGYFPAAAQGLDLHDVSFCHLDVAVYQATVDALAFVAPRLAPQGFILLDDVGNKNTPGVTQAMSEFLATHKNFIAVRMFPYQAVLLPSSLW